MRYFFFFFLLFFSCTVSAQQIKIHSHNDYEQAEPFVNAWCNKAYTIEADVYAGKGLPVAHDKKDIKAGKTLVTMYLQPIIELFKKYHGYISDDTNYAPVLMIDIKENSEAVITELVKLLSPYRNVFDRSVNPKAVQVVLSGERGPIQQWTELPVYILFDGRPYETYNDATLKKVFFVSDSYINYYSNNKDSLTANLKQLATNVHNMHKLLRLWATPDNPSSWEMLLNSGVDIINTDKVAGCRNYFQEKHQ